ncbi:MAG TPA: alginate export family protein, partial [Candidatus Udaeobacter sp.]|nr:alginate export family protein [Candidatus Udaeobacter sp.]
FSGTVAGHGFRLDQSRDAWYDATGAIKLPADPGRTHRGLGSEIDLTLRLDGIESTTIEGGYSHFFRGQVIRDAIAEDTDSDWAYISIKVDI